MHRIAPSHVLRFIARTAIILLLTVDLHKHTGANATLPTEGLVTSAEPSYLDYPDSKKDGVFLIRFPLSCGGWQALSHLADHRL
jgi:hypothetical protein